MSVKLENFIKTTQLKTDLPDVRPGDTVRIYQKIKEFSKKAEQENKERVQFFEGLIIAKKHGKEIGATITVRRIISGIGVEKIFSLYSPTISKIEIVKRGKTRRAKLYYLRKAKDKKTRLKQRETNKTAVEEKSEDIVEKVEKEKPEEKIEEIGKE